MSPLQEREAGVSLEPGGVVALGDSLFGQPRRSAHLRRKIPPWSICLEAPSPPWEDLAEHRMASESSACDSSSQAASSCEEHSSSSACSEQGPTRSQRVLEFAARAASASDVRVVQRVVRFPSPTQYPAPRRRLPVVVAVRLRWAACHTRRCLRGSDRSTGRPSSGKRVTAMTPAASRRPSSHLLAHLCSYACQPARNPRRSRAPTGATS